MTGQQGYDKWEGYFWICFLNTPQRLRLRWMGVSLLKSVLPQSVITIPNYYYTSTVFIHLDTFTSKRPIISAEEFMVILTMNGE